MSPGICLIRAAGLLQAAMLGAVLLALSSAGRALAGEPWPDVPMPPRADLQWVAQSMRVNGVPTKVLQFQSHASRAEIVDYYRSCWSGGYPQKPSVHPLGEATVIAQKHGPFLMTVKVEDAEHGASRGLLSVAQLTGVRVERNPGDLPLMDGAHVLQVVESDDPGKHSRNVVLVTPQPPSAVAQFYTASFGDAGWRQLQGNDTAVKPGMPAGSFLVFAHGGTEMQLSIVATPKGHSSVVVAIRVTKDTGPAG